MLRGYSVIDAHCDTLLSVIGANAIAGIQGRLNFFQRNEKSYIDLSKLLEGGVTASSSPSLWKIPSCPELGSRRAVL